MTVDADSASTPATIAEILIMSFSFRTGENNGMRRQKFPSIFHWLPRCCLN
jgi:hypothetical protein